MRDHPWKVDKTPSPKLSSNMIRLCVVVGSNETDMWDGMGWDGYPTLTFVAAPRHLHPILDFDLLCSHMTGTSSLPSHLLPIPALVQLLPSPLLPSHRNSWGETFPSKQSILFLRHRSVQGTHRHAKSCTPGMYNRRETHRTISSDCVTNVSPISVSIS